MQKNANRSHHRRLRRQGRAESLRRALNTERLEHRLLLASDFHNAANPYDVNVDGTVAPMDAVIVLSDMKRNGIRALTLSARTEAEGETSKMMVDVNADGFLTPLDALQVLRGLAEPAPGDPQVQFRLFLTNATTGQPVTAVNVGETIIARFTHQDIRDPNDPQFPDLNGDPANKGLFSSYIDVAFSDQVSLVTNFFSNPTETFRHGATYKQFNNFPGQFPTIGDGLIQDLGGLLTDVLTIPGPGEFDLVSMAFEVEGADVTAVDDDFNIEENSTSNELDVLDNDSLDATVTIAAQFADGSGNEVLTYLADDPSTNPNSQKVPEDEIIFPSVDLPINGAALTGLAILSTTSGTATVDVKGAGGADDVIVYTPQAGFAGQAEIVYTIGDGLGTVVTATATVSVGPVNDAPINTVPGTQTTPEDTALAFSTATSNRISIADSDAAAGTMTVDLTTVSGGRLTATNTAGVTITGQNSAALRLEGTLTAVNTALNTLVYTPALNSTAQDRLVIVTNDNGNTGDGGARTDTDTVTINISAVNDAPINNVPGEQNGEEDTPLVFSNANGNLISITDVDAGDNNIQVALNLTTNVGNPGTLTLSTTTGLQFQSGANGTSAMTVRGTRAAINAALAGATYTPASAFIGDVNLAINTSDLGNSGSGGAQTDADTVIIHVDPSVRPRARNDSETVAEDSVDTQIDVLNNDIPNENFDLVLVSFEQGSNGGQVERVGDVLVYTPAPDFFGTETFTYVIDDTSPDGVENEGTVFITVTEVNDSPQVVDDLASTNEDTQVQISTASVLSNDLKGPANEDSQSLTVVNVSTTLSGATATLSGNTITFQPPSNFNGSALVTYTIRDNGTTNGAADPKEDTGTITITVRSVNDAPVAVNDPATTAEDTDVVISASSLTTNDSPGGGADEANQTLTVTAVSATSTNGGTVTLVGGNITYSPADNFNGSDTFTYTLTDNGTSDGNADPKTTTGTVTVTVTEVNDAPIVVDDNDTGIKDLQTSYNGSDLLANDSPGPANESGQTLTIASVNATSQQGGTVVLDGQTIRYTPPTGYTGPDVITYVVRDNGTTNGVADPKTTEAHLNLNVLDFVPSSISGHVFLDANRDGVKSPLERAIGGVQITLQGEDFRGVPVNIPAVTNHLGFYEFTNLAPGDYTVVEHNPHMIADGNDGANDPQDSFTVQIGDLGGVTSENNDFAELSLHPDLFTIHEILASTTGNGLLVGSDDDGNQLWYIVLDGWSGCSNLTTTFNSTRTQVTAVVQRSSTSQNLPPKTFDIDGNKLRFMGRGTLNGSVLRFHGTAQEFGYTLAANQAEAEGRADLPEAAEGEMDAYRDAVDSIMTEASWA